MVDAAIEAGVKRIVLSEYSSNLEAKAKDVNLVIVKDKFEIRNYVEETTQNTNTEWSSINNGPFFDFAVKMVRLSLPLSISMKQSH
jgi:penicillin-binding protein-related factor A (putative recombinase)